MKVRGALPLTLLLASTCVAAAAAVGAADATKKVELSSPKDASSKEQIAAMNKQIQDGLAERKVETGVSARATQPASEPYYGTKDAPVDGLDGKPHAGPFVDMAPEVKSSVKGAAAAATQTSKAVPTGLEKLKEAIPNIPEKNDGVMDDIDRLLPAPGTTGTEGGVSEKEKAKSKQGPLVENTPPAPKEAPPLPHSEQERIKEQQGKSAVKPAKGEEVSAKTSEKDMKSQDKTGSMGIEKPEDLPAKPHDMPHPDPKDPAGQGESIKTSYPGKGRLVETLPYTEGEKPKQQKLPAKVGSLDDGHEHSFEEWFHSFVVSLTMIIFTEIGDKTFLVAALMAMRHDRLVVFSAAFSALIAMTVLSAVLGHLAPTLLPKRWTTFAAALLFIVFGARMLKEGLAMSKSAGVGEEMKEVEAELEEKEHDLASRASRKDGLHILESGRKDDVDRKGSNPSAFSGLANLVGLVFSPAWVQTFIMTFLGEWGDRSQIATIAMAAGQDYWWVTLGAILGHACCTGIAVLGGRALAGKVSMRVGESACAEYSENVKLMMQQSRLAVLLPSSSLECCIFSSAIPKHKITYCILHGVGGRRSSL